MDVFLLVGGVFVTLLADGQVVELIKGDEQVKEIFDYAARYEESRRLRYCREDFRKRNDPQEESLYTKLFICTAVIVLLIILTNAAGL